MIAGDSQAPAVPSEDVGGGLLSDEYMSAVSSEPLSDEYNHAKNLLSNQAPGPPPPSATSSTPRRTAWHKSKLVRRHARHLKVTVNRDFAATLKRLRKYHVDCYKASHPTSSTSDGGGDEGGTATWMTDELLAVLGEMEDTQKKNPALPVQQFVFEFWEEKESSEGPVVENTYDKPHNNVVGGAVGGVSSSNGGVVSANGAGRPVSSSCLSDNGGGPPSKLAKLAKPLPESGEHPKSGEANDPGENPKSGEHPKSGEANDRPPKSGEHPKSGEAQGQRPPRHFTLVAACAGFSVGNAAYHDYTMGTFTKDHRSFGTIASKTVGHILQFCRVQLWYWGCKIGYMAEYDGEKYGGRNFQRAEFAERWRRAVLGEGPRGSGAETRRAGVGSVGEVEQSGVEGGAVPSVGPTVGGEVGGGVPARAVEDRSLFEDVVAALKAGHGLVPWLEEEDGAQAHVLHWS